MKMPPPPRSNALRHHPLALCLGTACVAATPFQAGIAAILPVTSCVDDGSPGTLRSVIDSAVDGDVVDLTQLTCSTITLTQGTIGTDFLSDHPVNYLTIQGPGRDALTISGGGQFLVFSAGGYNIYGVFTLNDVTVAHGVNVNTASPWYESGSCIFAVRGSVTLDRVTVTDCHSTFLGGVGGGGAVDVDGVLKIIDSTISDSSVDAVGGNTAQGGGAWAGGRMEVVRSTITGNRVSAPLAADGYHGFQKTGGGGLYATGDLVVIDSTITGNTVEATDPGENGRGGGVMAYEQITIVGSTISGNSTDGDGGGVLKLSSRGLSDDSILSISDSTITGNVAGGTGGGIASLRWAELTNSTVAFNYSVMGGALMVQPTNIQYDPDSTLLTLQSSIVAGNTASAGASHATDLAMTGKAQTVQGASNLVRVPDPTVVLPPDTLATDPDLLPLAWNGGPTQTLALGPGSPAIDAGNNAAGLEYDQRGAGYPRVIGASADIGAFESPPRPDAIFANGFDP